jgi:hypothetical protein
VLQRAGVLDERAVREGFPRCGCCAAGSGARSIEADKLLVAQGIVERALESKAEMRTQVDATGFGGRGQARRGNELRGSGGFVEEDARERDVAERGEVTMAGEDGADVCVGELGAPIGGGGGVEEEGAVAVAGGEGGEGGGGRREEEGGATAGEGADERRTALEEGKAGGDELLGREAVDRAF